MCVGLFSGCAQGKSVPDQLEKPPDKIPCRNKWSCLGIAHTDTMKRQLSCHVHRRFLGKFFLQAESVLSLDYLLNSATYTS
jgi:hypothetical protein